MNFILATQLLCSQDINKDKSFIINIAVVYKKNKLSILISLMCVILYFLLIIPK